MKEKADALKNKMVAFVKENPGCARDAVAKAIGCAPINVSKMGHGLVQAGVMEYTNKTYRIIETKKRSIKDRAPKAKTVVAPVKSDVKSDTKKEVKTEKKEETAEEKAKNFGRDFGKYSFQGELLRKGAFVLALVHAVVKKNPNITYKELLKHFPNSLVRTFGVIVPLAEAKKANAKGRIRYFTKHGQIVHLTKDGAFAVTNQISSQNFEPIVNAAKAAGIKIA